MASGRKAWARVAKSAEPLASPRPLSARTKLNQKGAMQVCSLEKHAQRATHKAAVTAFLAGNMKMRRSQ
eukprot:7559551-Pyramimonas_sp.AAC.1